MDGVKNSNMVDIDSAIRYVDFIFADTHLI
jgi:hypothetical protein